MNKETTHLVQVTNQARRRVALVSEPNLILLNQFSTVYEMAIAAIDSGTRLKDLITSSLSNETLDYDSVYHGNTDWKLLPCFDHPVSPLMCMISGTGLTHKNSALNRQMMHRSPEDKPTDSMQMYQWGVEGGSPKAGDIGVQPEWFYKGNGSTLKGHGETLEVPAYANDGGEEPELAGIYIIAKNGEPYRVGFATGNEFSDHVMEKKNYLYLAPSKLRECSIGPELVIDADFTTFSGKVSVSRSSEVVWSSDIKSGEANMAHNLANLEYHHFKYAGHRVPLQVHIHFFGADAFSFGSQVKLLDGDVMSVAWNGLGRPLLNYLKVSADREALVDISRI